MSKVEVLNKTYPILVKCFEASHGEIFGMYWADSGGDGRMPEEVAYNSVEECYKDLREDIYYDANEDGDYMKEEWAEIDNEVGDDSREKIKRMMLYNDSHGEVWGGVCSKLYHSTNEECWKLLNDLLVLLGNEKALGRIGWDS